MALSQGCLLVALLWMLKLKKRLNEFRLENEALKNIKSELEKTQLQFELAIKKLNKAE